MMKNAFTLISRFSLLLCIVSLAGIATSCRSTYDFMRASPAEVTNFIPESPKLQDQDPRFPFRKMWIANLGDLSQYKKIYIAPVDTRHIFDKNWWAAFNEQEAFKGEKEALDWMSGYMRTSFRNAVFDDPKKRFVLLNSRSDSPDSLVLELALIELIPSKATLNTVETIVGFIIPGVGLLTIFNSGSVAIEGKLTDASNGKIICLFADRESDRASVINIAGFSWFRHSEIIVNCWASDFVEVMNAGSDPWKVEARFPFTLVEY